MKTYKTTDPATLAALAAQNKACKALQAQGPAFKERFGAAHFIGGNTLSTGYKIHGLVFEPPKPRLLWTAPDRQAAGRSASAHVTGQIPAWDHDRGAACAARGAEGAAPGVARGGADGVGQLDAGAGPARHRLGRDLAERLRAVRARGRHLR